jgi:long-chain acyl-CoA synthetase
MKSIEVINFKNKDNIMVIDENNQEYTYGEIYEKALNFSRYLDVRSVILICGTNDLDTIVAYIGALMVECVPLFLNYNVEEKLVDRFIDTYKPKYLFIRKKFTIANYNREVKLDKYSLFIMNGIKNNDIHSDLMILLPTSGSTGDIKVVKLSIENINANISSIVEYLRMNERDKTVTTLPINYSYGLSIINTHFKVGGTVYLNNKSILEKSFWEKIVKSDITNFSGVPFTYEIISKMNNFKLFPHTVRTLTQAGGKLSNEIILQISNNCKKLNIDFYTMYGQTEAGPRIAFLQPEKLIEKVGSIGKAIPGGKIWLEDENKKRINEPGILGELVYEGKNVGMGYAETKNDLKKDDEWKGRLRTGDIAKFDSEYYLYIFGRIKRFVKIAGVRISLDQVESNLRNENIIGAVVGRDDAMRIYVEGEKNIEMIARIRKICNECGVNTNKYKIKFIDKIPNFESGKINYKELEKNIEE